MPFFDSAGIKIHYYDAGSGAAVVLVHGFASTVDHNWGGTGWMAALSQQYRVIAPDVRGHGLSDKPHAPTAYGYASMGADVTRLMDHLGIERALLMGYSMGASIAIELMVSRPERFRAIVLGGIAYDDGLEDQADRDAIAAAYRADDPATIKSPVAKAYRRFAESMPNDLKALAALIDAERSPFDPAKLAAVRMPVLIVVGTEDNAIGDPEPLAKMIPGARLVMLEGRDHMTAPADQRFKDVVLEFLGAARL
ncbi:alpha/beta fold hydrolase [Candidatus Binatus sp.]|uniref:alpha/beta fold hydrolase n=1 Tax=Candidatus Binatus sp. TaxID=2811406 RepID=UPI003C48A085